MQRQSGFSLLEVLITIVIMAIGLLGLAGLTAASMRNSHGSYNRSQAVWLSYDIADRMRANRASAVAGNYNTLLTDGAPGGGSVSATDLGQWKAAVAGLPAGQGQVESLGANQFRITIRWNDTRATGGVADQQFVVQTQL